MTGAVASSLARIAEDLAGLEVRWALVGGFAVSARATPRFTHDVDLCVLVESDAEAEEVVFGLTHLGYSVVALVDHEQTGRLATIRLISPLTGGVPVDLLFASSGIESETVTSAELLEILPGLVLPVARTPHLVVLKLLARDDQTRPQDGIDLRALRPALTSEGEVETLRLAQLVVDRGYARGRDLVSLAEGYLATAPQPPRW